MEKEMSMDVKGRDQVTGLPKTVNISSEEIRAALTDPAKAIVEVIKSTLEVTPAELAADLVDRGIIMSGGGSLIRGLPELVAQETELPVNLADDPLTCVARGTGAYLEELDNIKNSKKIKI
jgi:rod shape-determining protein MreB